MYTFETVTLAVTLGSTLLAISGYFRPTRALDEMARTGVAFHHAEDQPIEQRPDEDAVDPPLPRRALRAWPF